MIDRRLFAAVSAVMVFVLLEGAAEVRASPDRPLVVAANEENRQAAASEDDKAGCHHARTLYQGMLATGTNSWKGTPRDRVLADVKSCEATGHVAR